MSLKGKHYLCMHGNDILYHENFTLKHKVFSIDDDVNSTSAKLLCINLFL